LGAFSVETIFLPSVVYMDPHVFREMGSEAILLPIAGLGESEDGKNLTTETRSKKESQCLRDSVVNDLEIIRLWLWVEGAGWLRGRL
jgi:hypothetical protein